MHLSGKESILMKSNMTFFLGDVSGITGLPNMVGMEAGSILLSPVQASALGMSLLQGPDGAINLLNSIQVIYMFLLLIKWVLHSKDYIIQQISAVLSQMGGQLVPCAAGLLV